jgi:radical SAM superfamily enzyme YgiQ (UPF0313 family)
MSNLALSDEGPPDVLLVQPVIRHPVDAALHNAAFNQYFHWMKRLAAAMDFFSLVASAVPSPPTQILSLAAYLRAARIKVAVADLNLSYLAEAKEPEQELRKRLADEKPRILAIGAMESYLLEAVYRLVRVARQHDPDIFIVLGGVDATAMDTEILRTGHADAVVRGEGEASLAGLCRAVTYGQPLDGVAGIAWIEGHRVVRNPDRPFMDLAALPLPARDLYPLAQMYRLNGGVDAVYGSRGCPHRCLFCHGPAFWKSQWRGRPPAHIVRELIDIAARGGRVAFLYDMNFGHDREWALDLARKITGADPGLVWGCELRVDHLLDRSFLEALHRAGCRSVFVGIESMDQKALTGVDKDYPAHALAAGLKNAARAGIGVEATVMIGLPEDTADTIRRTTDAVIRLFQDERLKLVHYFLCVPWPGTAIGDHPERYGIDIACRKHAHLITAPSVPVASTKYLSAEGVYALWEAGVLRLSEATRQKLLLQAFRAAFDD